MSAGELRAALEEAKAGMSDNLHDMVHAGADEAELSSLANAMLVVDLLFEHWPTLEAYLD